MPTNIRDIFGTIEPPNPTSANPVEGLGRVIAVGINLFLIVAALFMLLYLLWGALDWIMSSGEKERLTKAQGKITNAVIGMMVVIVALIAFNVIAINVLHIVGECAGGGFCFPLPRL